MFMEHSNIFLAAQSSSRSLVVGWSAGLLETFVKKWPLKHEMVTKTFLHSNLCDSSDCSDISNSSDTSDSSDSSDSSALHVSALSIILQ